MHALDSAANKRDWILEEWGTKEERDPAVSGRRQGGDTGCLGGWGLVQVSLRSDVQARHSVEELVRATIGE